MTLASALFASAGVFAVMTIVSAVLYVVTMDYYDRKSAKIFLVSLYASPILAIICVFAAIWVGVSW